jgi:hypothetical protein
MKESSIVSITRHFQFEMCNIAILLLGLTSLSVELRLFSSRPDLLAAAVLGASSPVSGKKRKLEDWILLVKASTFF